MSTNAGELKPVIVITGANNGIGFYMASALLADGYRVAALDLSGENLITLRRDYPDRLLSLKCDVTSDRDVELAVGEIIGRWSQVDVLVNNACIAIYGRFEDKTMEITRKELEVNYFGYVRMIYAVLPYMKARKQGIIHNVSSAVGITGYEGIYGYCSTKGAIEALTRTLALELAPYGIAVNTMHPTLTQTKSAMTMGIPKEAMMAKPEDVGRKLAKKVMSTKPVVTGDLMTGVFTGLSQKYPKAMGNLLHMMTQRANKKKAAK